MYVGHSRVNGNQLSRQFEMLRVLEFCNFCYWVYGKVEKQPLCPRRDHPDSLFIRHSVLKSETFCLLSHVIVVNVERHLLLYLTLPRGVAALTLPALWADLRGRSHTIPKQTSDTAILSVKKRRHEDV